MVVLGVKYQNTELPWCARNGILVILYFGTSVFWLFCTVIVHCVFLVFSAVFWPFCILGLRDLTGVVRFGGRAQNTEIPNYRCVRVMVLWSLGISVFWPFCILGLRDLIGVVRICVCTWRKIPK